VRDEVNDRVHQWVTLVLDQETIRELETLRGGQTGYTTLEQVCRYILTGFADGVRRPGSWERECVTRFFGEVQS
jgi:hypothetical protein